MKKTMFLLVAFLAVATAFAQKPPIQFNKLTHSFGKIKQHVPATYVFTFKNVSDKPVVIESAVAGCGCTTPEYPKGAIAKGASGKIKVTYNAEALNTFTKQVTVKIANVAQPIVLNIGGEVVEASTTAAKPSTAAKKKS
jgi:hypothetical protein